MAESYSVKAVLSAADSGFSSTMNKAMGSVSKLGNSGKALGGKFGRSMKPANTSVLGLAKSIGLVSVAGKAFNVVSGFVGGMVGDLSKSSATWKVFNGNMQTFGKSKSEIAGVKSELQDFAQKSIYSSSDMASTYSQLAAVGTKNTTQLVKGFGGLASAAEDPQQAMKTLSQQATQMAAKPMVQWQDFKLMLEQTPAGMAAVAKSMHMSTGDLVKNVQAGKVSTEDFFNAIAKTGTNANFTKMATQFKTVGQAADGLKETIVNKLQGAFDNMSQVGINAIVKLTDWIQKIDFDAIIASAVKFGTDVYNAIMKVVNYVQQNSDWLAPIAVGIAAGVTAFMAINGAIKIATTTMAIFNAIMSINPFVALIVAITAVFAGLVYFFTQTKTGQAVWKAFTDILSNLWQSLVEIASTVWTAITNTFNTAVGIIKGVWSGIVEFFSGLWEGIKSTASGVWNSIVAAVAAAVQGVQTAWNGIVTFFSGLWTGIVNTAVAVWTGFTAILSAIWTGIVALASGVWNGLIAFFTMLWTGIVTGATNIWATLGGSLTAIWNGIVTVATGIWNMLKTVIMTPILLLIDLLTGSWSQLKADAVLGWTSLVDAATTIWNGLVAIIGGIVSAVVAVIVQAWTNVVTTTTTIFNAVKSFIVSVWNGIKSAVVNAANAVKTGAVNAWNALKSGVVNAANAVKQGAINAWNSLKSGVVNAANAVKQGAINAWNSLKSGVVNAANAVKSGAVNAWNSLKSGVVNAANSLKSGAISAWNGLKSGVINIANGIKQGAINAWNGMVDGVKRIIGNVKGAFDALRNIDLGEAGRKIINGFLKGLKGAFDSVKKFIGGIGDWIRDHKGPIRVDRKLLIPAGNSIMDGLNNGLTDNFKAVKKNVSSMSGAIAAAAAVQLPGVDSNKYSASINRLGRSGAAANVNSNINSSIQVTVQTNLDGKQVAETIARPMRDQLGKLDQRASRRQGYRAL